MKTLNKDKEKGKVYGTMKKMKKKNRLLEEKATAQRTENKRINAENRKVRREKNEQYEKISEVSIIEFSKNMLSINIEGDIEKRALIFDEKIVSSKNFKDQLPKFKIKLYGIEVEISELNNFKEIREKLEWELEALFK